MTPLKTLGLSLIAAAAIASAAHAQEALGDLTLSFPGLKSTSGKLMIGVYDGAAGWAASKPVRVAVVPAADATAKIVALPPGTYGVKVFQDVDGDGKLARDNYGYPTEPFGFSRDAPITMGPPSFDDAAFAVKAGANTQVIHLK
ncbi:DUF2141 domain-containing protein [uncultured Caulobacter sp.]|uniref:DUF2141 domain-containing protein n=1 Tax=uncultured Caulobacter sp. TaxID=158749 RepID=UPI00262A3C8B|nr:DUF2141 domain-containing protein [uncultured Caulobacter sp.]